jgi:hypothetical protein
MTPFQALYGFPPPMITEGIIPDSVVQDARDMMQAKLTTLNNIKHNLQLAQERMKKNDDKKRTKRALEVGYMAYLKMQPYRHNSLGLHNSLKLPSKFYRLFKVLQKVEQVAYKLLLSDDCTIHPAFTSVS